MQRLIGFSAYSGTGKTTLIEKLLICLKTRGFRVAVIKHDAHGFEIDRRGTDSWRFTHAGAEMTILTSPEKTAVIDRRPHTLYDDLALVHGVDLILVEGYKHEPIPQIGILRKASGKDLPYKPEHYLAVVTDDETISEVPRFDLDDVAGICDFILKNAKPVEDFQKGNQ